MIEIRPETFFSILIYELRRREYLLSLDSYYQVSYLTNLKLCWQERTKCKIVLDFEQLNTQTLLETCHHEDRLLYLKSVFGGISRMLT